MSLVSPKGTNKYCGPAALSSVLGISTDYASVLCREITKRTYTKGLHPVDLENVLIKNNVKFKFKQFRKTFNQVHLQQLIKKPAICVASRHYFAYDGSVWCDSGFWGKNRDIYSADVFPHKRAIVQMAFIIDSHSIVEPVKERQATYQPSSFVDLINLYATRFLKEEMEHVEYNLRGYLDDTYADADEAALLEMEESGKLKELFIEDWCNVEASYDDKYSYGLFEQAVDDMNKYGTDDLKAIKTIRLLNGKYRFVKIQK